MDAKIENAIKLSPNMEDYLEAIAFLRKNNGVARVKDLSRLMNVKTPSVTGALNILSKKGFVIHERYGYIDLTLKGERLAQSVFERHNILIRFLTTILNVDSQIAAEDACKMEHAISPQTFRKILKFVEFVDTCPRNNRPKWLKNFDYYSKASKRIPSRNRRINRA